MRVVDEAANDKEETVVLKVDNYLFDIEELGEVSLGVTFDWIAGPWNPFPEYMLRPLLKFGDLQFYSAISPPYYGIGVRLPILSANFLTPDYKTHGSPHLVLDFGGNFAVLERSKDSSGSGVWHEFVASTAWVKLYSVFEVLSLLPPNWLSEAEFFSLQVGVGVGYGEFHRIERECSFLSIKGGGGGGSGGPMNPITHQRMSGLGFVFQLTGAISPVELFKFGSELSQ